MKDSESNNGKMSRRHFLAAAGTTSVAAVAGCSSLPFGGKSEFEQELDEVRSAVEQYDGDIQAAIEDGYEPLGPFVPGMGWHFQNQEYVNNAAEDGFDITEPQILNFDNEGNLGAVEYGAPAEQVSGSPNLFSTENADATEEWGLHEGASHAFSDGDDEVTPLGELPTEEVLNVQNWTEFRPVDMELEAGDTYTAQWGGNPMNEEGVETEEEERLVDFAVHHPDLVALHVWAIVDNPNGIFTGINPEFAQP